MWGNNIRAVIAPASKGEDADPRDRSECVRKKYVVKNGGGFNPGDVVKIF